MISILSRNLEAHELTAWKNTAMLMKPKIGGGAPCAYNGFMKRALNSVFFCLINLSDGLIFLIFVFDLRLAVFDVLFLNYMFPISL